MVGPLKLWRCFFLPSIYTLGKTWNQGKCICLINGKGKQVFYTFVEKVNAKFSYCAPTSPDPKYSLLC